MTRGRRHPRERGARATGAFIGGHPTPRTSAEPPFEAPEVHRQGSHDAILIKPAGLSVELPERGGAAGRGDVRAARSLLEWARARWPEAQPRLPHRLDRMARGIVVVALTPESAAFHAAAVRERRWTKLYLARVAPDVAGREADLVGFHRVYLRTRGRRAEVVRSGGDVAEMEVLAAAPAPPPTPGAPDAGGRGGWGATSEQHVLIRLVTGRHHQIRATLAHRGAPIAGDPIYDPQAGRRRRPPYLEHALLRLPCLDAPDGAVEEVIWRPNDPRREAIDSVLLEAITRLASSPGR